MTLIQLLHIKNEQYSIYYLIPLLLFLLLSVLYIIVHLDNQNHLNI